ncbi:MAG: hypothetical protein ACQXXJ_00755, partial [Candidatus Bathyarchaeia archaeon]
MSVNSITLPFIVKTQGEKESLTYAAEVAYMTCMAEMQRKKASFLRDTPEKLVLLAKLYYPLWVVPVENHSVVLDGLGALAYKFSFKEPARVGQFIEELKRNRVNPDRFMDVLERHAGKIGELESQVTAEFKGLIADRELLALLLDYFKLGQPLTEAAGSLSKALVPIEVDEDGAAKAGKNVINCLRTILADVKSVEYALSVLKEAVAF